MFEDSYFDSRQKGARAFRFHPAFDSAIDLDRAELDRAELERELDGYRNMRLRLESARVIEA